MLVRNREDPEKIPSPGCVGQDVGFSPRYAEFEEVVVIQVKKNH